LTLKNVEQPKPAFAGLAGHAGRGGHRPVDRGRLGRPGVEHGVLGLGVAASAEHVIAHRDAGDSIADLVDHAGGVGAEVPGALHGLAAGHGAADGFPVDRVHAGASHRDPDLAGAGVWIRSLGPLQDLRTAVRRELQRSHPTILPPWAGQPPL
jgi:hypothetical protein